MIERLTSITELPVDEIQISQRLRDVSPEGVQALVETIEANGFVGRIVVRRTKKGDYVLDGAHRLTALRELGRATIPCDVLRCSDDEALMFEIDGNLAGSRMTSLQIAYFLAARRRTFQRLNPEAKQGYAGALARLAAGDMVSLAQTIADERGITKRHVYRLMAAGDAIGPDEYRRLAAAPKAVQLKDLFALSKIDNTGERYFVIDKLASGEAGTATAARRQYKAAQGTGPAPLSPSDQEFTRLCDAFDRARKAARRQFADKYHDELRALLAGGAE